MQKKNFNWIVLNISKYWFFITLGSITIFIYHFFKQYGKYDLFYFPFNSEVWGSFSDVITAFTSSVTLVVAAIALNTWKAQKLFDLEVEAKAYAWRATDYIYKFTQVPMTHLLLTGDDAERYTNLSKESQDLANCYTESFVIEYIRKKFEQNFIEINTISERLQAVFLDDKDKQNLLMFYKIVVQRHFDIVFAAFDYQDLKHKKYQGESVDEEELKKCNDFFYKGGMETITNEVRNSFLKLKNFSNATDEQS